MRSSHNLRGAFALVIAVLFTGTVAAVNVNHNIDGTKFDETFEGQTAGVAPAGANVSPGGNGESYTVVGTPVTLANPTAPTANQGVKFAQLNDNGDLLGAKFGSFVSQGVLTVKFAAYVGGVELGTRVRMRLKIGNDVCYNLTWDTANNDLQDNAGEIGLGFLRDTWQAYTVVYDYNTTGAGQPDDDTVTITVDGNTSGPRNTDLQNTSIDEVDWRIVQGSDVDFYLDALSTEPSPVAFSQVTLADTLSHCFTSEVGVVYTLQATTDLVSSSTWESVGADITGTGTNTYLFDPTETTGSSTSKAYRIVSE